METWGPLPGTRLARRRPGAGRAIQLRRAQSIRSLWWDAPSMYAVRSRLDCRTPEQMAVLLAGARICSRLAASRLRTTAQNNYRRRNMPHSITVWMGQGWRGDEHASCTNRVPFSDACSLTSTMSRGDIVEPYCILTASGLHCDRGDLLQYEL